MVETINQYGWYIPLSQWNISNEFKQDLRRYNSMVKEFNPYIENGYENRKDYLESLSEDYGVPLDVVYSLADMMPGEEFDGLVSALEDAEGMFEE